MGTRQRSALHGAAVVTFLREFFPPDCHALLWLAGGSARDSLLRREVRDIDLVAVLPAATLESLGFSYLETVSASPIWFRYFPGYGNVEITRLDSIDGLGEDLLRRDFTVNAMLLSLAGEVTDPLGGRNDLSSLTLRPCSDRTFLHDPIRIFRAFRFEAEGFQLSPEGKAQLGSRGWEEVLAKLPVERFSRELLRALQGGAPGRFFSAMLEADVGRSVLPELFSMPQVPAGPLHLHPEGDLFTHSLQVLERAAAVTGSVLGRFCAFFHDIGKLSSDSQGYPCHHGHDAAGFTAAEPFCRRLALPAEYGRALAWISRLHGSANRLAELSPAVQVQMAQQAARGGVGELLPIISAADRPGNDITGQWGELLAVAALNMAALGVEPEKLQAVRPENRADYLLRRRVAFLQKSRAAVISC